MNFEEMPIVHIYPHNNRGQTGHDTDHGHECWCEPRIVIVPPDHKFAMEHSKTRVVYHTAFASKTEQQDAMGLHELLYSTTCNRLLRSIPEPPEGGYEPILIAEGIDALVADVFANGWEQADEVPEPPTEGATGIMVPMFMIPLAHIQSWMDMHKKLREQFESESGIPACDLCGKPLGECTCDEDDEDDEDDNDGDQHVSPHY